MADTPVVGVVVPLPGASLPDRPTPLHVLDTAALLIGIDWAFGLALDHLKLPDKPDPDLIDRLVKLRKDLKVLVGRL